MSVWTITLSRQPGVHIVSCNLSKTDRNMVKTGFDFVPKISKKIRVLHNRAPHRCSSPVLPESCNAVLNELDDDLGEARASQHTLAGPYPKIRFSRYWFVTSITVGRVLVMRAFCATPVFGFPAKQTGSGSSESPGGQPGVVMRHLFPYRQRNALSVLGR